LKLKQKKTKFKAALTEYVYLHGYNRASMISVTLLSNAQRKIRRVN